MLLREPATLAGGTPLALVNQRNAVVLAVKGAAAEDAVALCGSALDGKVVLDATNPIANAPPTTAAPSEIAITYCQ